MLREVNVVAAASGHAIARHLGNLRPVVTDNFELIADARSRAIHGVRGQLQNAARIQADFGDPERAYVLFEVYDSLFTIEKQQIDREKHAECVDALTGIDPQPPARAIPFRGLAEQADKTSQIGVCRRDFCCYETVAGPVEDVHVGIVIHDTHASDPERVAV